MARIIKAYRLSFLRLELQEDCLGGTFNISSVEFGVDISEMIREGHNAQAEGTACSHRL